MRQSLDKSRNRKLGYPRPTFPFRRLPGPCAGAGIRERRIGARMAWRAPAHIDRSTTNRNLTCICGAEEIRRLQKLIPLHRATQDAVDLAKMVQVVCRFQADELLDRLASAYLVDPIALHPPCARDRLQQSQVALAQRPKDPCRKVRILLRVTQALRPYGLIPPR